MQLSSYRIVRSSTQPAKNQRVLPQMHSRSSPISRTMRRSHRESEQTHRASGQMRHRRGAHRYQRHRSRPVVPMSSKLQKRPRQRRRSRRRNRDRSIPHRPNQRQKIHCVCARTIYKPGQNRSSYKAPQRPFRRSRVVAPMPSRQRNPAQRNRLRGMIFIQSSRKSGLWTICRRAQRRRSLKSQMCLKSVVSYNPKPHKKNHPLFVMESVQIHGHRAARRPRLCAARSSLFVNGQQLHRRTIYHPRRRSRHGKPL